ncbi:MAG: hypothetical protein KatS3mg068_2665 [Candidatus Sericytochromatia bacterium]|nr:MAG: hypothetical protein KatS3mg068_2665 [Candidatus Sericytochromatia bacterium]
MITIKDFINDIVERFNVSYNVITGSMYNLSDKSYNIINKKISIRSDNTNIIIDYILSNYQNYVIDHMSLKIIIKLDKFYSIIDHAFYIEIAELDRSDIIYYEKFKFIKINAITDLLYALKDMFSIKYKLVDNNIIINKDEHKKLFYYIIQTYTNNLVDVDEFYAILKLNNKYYKIIDLTNIIKIYEINKPEEFLIKKSKRQSIFKYIDIDREIYKFDDNYYKYITFFRINDYFYYKFKKLNYLKNNKYIILLINNKKYIIKN